MSLKLREQALPDLDRDKLQQQTANTIVGLFEGGHIGFPDPPIKLKSGRQSPVYVNLRGLNAGSPDTPEDVLSARATTLRWMTLSALSLIPEGAISMHVFGPPQAGTPLAASVSALAHPVSEGRLHLPLIWQRVPEEGKASYGKHASLEGLGDYNGESPTEVPVLVLDDVATNGGSKVESAKALCAGMQKLNLTPLIIGPLVVVDRQEGAASDPAKAGMEVASLFDLDEVVKVLRSEGNIGDQEVEAVARYHEGLKKSGVASTYNAT